jgi:hypothetical protein
MNTTSTVNFIVRMGLHVWDVTQSPTLWLWRRISTRGNDIAPTVQPQFFVTRLRGRSRGKLIIKPKAVHEELWNWEALLGI